MPQKASTPWSARTIAEGGTDSPVGDLVPIPDKITPVVNTGFISLAGKYRGIPSDDLQFTFQDPEQALGAGASMFIQGVDMLTHDTAILAILDSSGNAINVDVLWMLPAEPVGPYNNPTFTDVGIKSGDTWQINKNTVNGTFYDIVNDASVTLAATWIFVKMVALQGTVGTLLIKSNEGANAGTISTAFLRLV